MKTTNAKPPESPDSACFFCGQEILDGHWFARIRDGEERVIFCRPRCVLRFLDQAAARARPEFAARESWESYPNGNR